MQCTSLTAAAEVGMALESEAVASAVREADFERMQREAAEASIASLHDALEKLKQKLKTTQVTTAAASAATSPWPSGTELILLCCITKRNTENTKSGTVRMCMAMCAWLGIVVSQVHPYTATCCKASC